MAMTELKDATALAMLAEDDLQKARTFWRDTLGLQEVYVDEQAGQATYKAGGTLFGIYQHQGGSKADHTQLGFQVTDVQTTKQALESKGITFEEYDLPGVKTVNGVAQMGEEGQGAWFLDPGGNIVGIFTATPQMMQMMGQAGQMAGAGMGMSR